MWSHSTEELSEGQSTDIWDENGLLIAQTFGPRATEIAPLIAAAPELLEALELTEATVERLFERFPHSANGTLDVIRAAIRKAKG